MNDLVDWVSELAGDVSQATADGSATFRVPGAKTTLSLNSDPGAEIALETSGEVLAGAVALTLLDARGGVQGAVHEGVSIEVGGQVAVVTSTANATLGMITLEFSPALTSTVAAGTPVEVTSRGIVVPHAVTMSERKAQVDFAAEGITFAFQYNYDSVGLAPRKGWIVTRVDRHGTRTGTVKVVHNPGVQVLVYAGS